MADGVDQPEGGQVIPLGTGGRPGRGSGQTRPSAAARGLAGGSRRTAPRRVPAPDPEPETDTGADTEIATGVGAPGAGAPGDAPRGPARTADRHPLGSVDVPELLAALTSAAQEMFADDWERRLAQLLATVRRRLSGEYPVDDYGFDQELTEQFFHTALRPLARHWFRIEVRGADNIPATGGALVVSNHSGTLPLDGLMAMVSVHDQTGRHLRPLAADLVFTMPVVSSLARKGGATLACNEDAERMLADGELVGVWPEGFKGIGKPFSERYKLQRFGRGGFVSAALRTGVPIVPLSIVGAEEIYPLVGNLPSLARLLGLPYIPITPLFPWLGPLGMVPLPSKWLMEFGEPVRTDTYDASEAEDPMLVFDVTDQVRETIQQTLYRLLRERGSVFGG